ncbi:peptide deformylase [Luteitalea sp. TBR-22]|uniref:peptide deformylase n=1 Tax=Luteitalea sp. TBR-22 TaxID=2802971 RepID=UPI001AF37929|nr:peptide deformylase [Luteitalea sp. TBR-22]BCS33623.1 peptide deformylase [Luteitalea sp. TBR-22]
MRRPILRYGDPVLHQKAAPVESITPAIDTLIADMRETLRAAAGVGLAAPQVGESVRLCLIDLSAGSRADQLLVLINPEILERDGLQLKEEGCLSLPGIEATVPRPLRMVVRAMDADGDVREIRAEGLLARALQHEIDHLDGVLFLDRLRPVYRWAIIRRIKRLRRAGKW